MLKTGLSAREFQVLIKLAAGVSVTQIGRELGISYKSVSTYRTRILLKLRLNTNADLTVYALKQGLIALRDKGELDDLINKGS